MRKNVSVGGQGSEKKECTLKLKSENGAEIGSEN
jgi:hypothetical protein